MSTTMRDKVEESNAESVSICPSAIPKKNAKLARHFLLAALAAAVLVVYYVFDPSMNGAGLPCMFNKITGWYCPGCGGQRALHALLHGRLAHALSYNLLAVILGAGLIAFSIYELLSKGQTRGKSTRRKRLGSVWWYLAAMALVFGICRNLPWPPFSYLAP